MVGQVGIKFLSLVNKCVDAVVEQCLLLQRHLYADESVASHLSRQNFATQ